ncbi:MAG: LysR family transcriptional regulator [Oscillospiraceae bacterium]|nr:LysR family transcriptional regulator [Oscillospiraceae bacterium]
MTLRQLQYIITVAARGSITEAAKELFIAQPSLTAAIRELEQEMGVTIFYRSRKGVELTPEDGDRLYPAGEYHARTADKAVYRNHYRAYGALRSFVIDQFIQMSRASPRNMTAPAILPLAGALVGASTRNSGSGLKIHANLGRDVCPVTTTAIKATAKTNSEK